MTITVKVGEAKTHLSELLAKVEAGEEIIIARGNDPIARLTRFRQERDIDAVIAEIKAARARAKPVSMEEILLGGMRGINTDDICRRRLDSGCLDVAG